MVTMFPPPTMFVEDPVLTAVCTSACTATGATNGWVIAVVGDQLQVVAALGPLAGRIRGLAVGVDGSAGFVAASGQPLAVTPRPGDANVAGGVLGAVGVVPTALASLPCYHGDEVLGVLELVDKADGGRFSFDDVDFATLLAAVAGPALAHRVEAPAAADPDTLAGQLRQLLEADPLRYGRTAWVIQQLLGSA
jgi:GAF domain-containing protein